jgi:hypothetical protein
MRPPRLRSFRKSLTWSGVILFELAIAARAMAGFQCRRFPTLQTNMPRSTVPQYRERRSFDWFLANCDPNIVEMKVRNHGLLYEGSSRSRIPALQLLLGAASVPVAGVGWAQICQIDGPGEQ